MLINKQQTCLLNGQVSAIEESFQHMIKKHIFT